MGDVIVRLKREYYMTTGRAVAEYIVTADDKPVKTFCSLEDAKAFARDLKASYEGGKA